MKKLKVLLSAGLCLMITLTMTSCGNPYSDIKFDDYIEVGTYEGLEITPITVEVTDAEVETEIQTRREEKKTTKNVKEGTVKEGDTINIDYVGSIDGVKFDGGEEEGRDLTIGSNTFIEGFEEGLIGAKVGTTQNIKVQFPENYSEESLAGKNAVFAVKINTLQVDEVPELDEEFVKENSDVETVEEYRALVKEELTKSKKAEQEATQRTQLWTQLISSSTIKTDKDGNEKYPQEELDRVVEETTSLYEDAAKKSNMTLEDYVTQNFGMDKETFDEQVEELAKIMVKEEMILYYIARNENIRVTDDEYDQFIEDTLTTYGYTEETFEEANNGKSYEKVVGKDYIKQEALKEKIQKWIVEHGKETTA